jgi:hypothetical protein
VRHGSKNVAAPPVANWENDFCISGAMLVVQPSLETWSKIKEKMALYTSKSKTEMNLINEFFTKNPLIRKKSFKGDQDSLPNNAGLHWNALDKLN